MTAIYLIVGENTLSGEDLDWFVEAESVDQAVALYKQDFLDDERIESEDEIKIDRVYRVPDVSGFARVLGWGIDVQDVSKELTDASTTTQGS